MGFEHTRVDRSKLLRGMYQDDYFPVDLVDKVRDVLLDACLAIEYENPTDLPSLYAITCRATERINDLQAEFTDNGSEIETAARDDIGLSFSYIAEVYGFPDADPEELIATRDW